MDIFLLPKLIILGILIVIIGYAIGIKYIEWGFNRGAEMERKDPYLFLNRINISIADTRKLNSFTRESVETLIKGCRTLKVQIYENKRYMDEKQIKIANSYSNDLDDMLETYNRYLSLMVEDRVYKIQELI